MADYVMKQSEDILPELEQMHRVGLFEESEIKAIIKKTTAHEYKLVRRVKEKKDFLAFIQYKIHLLALIRKRRKRRNYYHKKDEIEYAIVGKIHRLFKQSTARWPEDIKLWMSHVEFCKEWNKKTQLSKIWTSLLQIHGNSKVNLWVMAAKFELEGNNSVENARAVFLLGLRHHPEEQKLWQEYFRMELMYASKARQRLALLAETEDKSAMKNESEFQLLNGELAEIVYKNANEAIPNNPQLKCNFLEIAIVFSFFAGNLLNMIIEDLENNHSNDALARSTLAKLHVNPSMLTHGEDDSSITIKADLWSAEKRVWEDYEESVNDLDTNEMWAEYFSYLYGKISTLLADEQPIEFEVSGHGGRFHNRAIEDIPTMKIKKFIEVATRAHENNRLGCDNYLKFVNTLVKLHKHEEAIRLLEESTEKHDSIDLKLKLLELLINQDNEDNKKKLPEFFRNVSILTCEMNVNQEKIFWEMWFDFAKMTNDEDILTEVLKCTEKSRTAGVHEVKAAYLKFYAEKHGIIECIDLYKNYFTKDLTPSLIMGKTMIDLLQQSNLKSGTFDVYEDLINHFGYNDPQLWLDYIKCMIEYDATKVSNLYWRAMKNLKPGLTEQFTVGYTLLHTNTK